MSEIFDISQLLQLLTAKDSVNDNSLLSTVEATKEKIDNVVTDSKTIKTTVKNVNDAYGNSLTSTGVDDKVKSFTTYGFSNDTMNWTFWTALYNDSWVFKRAIDKPAQDMVRSGVNIELNSEKKNAVMSLLKSFRQEFIELIQWGRLYGGSVAVMMFDNFKDKDYKKPIDIDMLRKAKKMSLYVTDRWYGCAASSKTVSKMSSLDYGKPTSYSITFADGHTIDVHHDFILRYEGRSAPRLVKNGVLMGWGYAEGCHVINELARDDQLKSSITSLINKALIEVIKMPGMRALFMGPENENAQQIQKRLEMVNYARTFNSLTFLDKDDEYQEHGFGGLGGLSDLLEKNMWLISAALEMQNVLYGDLKNGMGADGDALERYDETINNLNEGHFRCIIEKFLSVVYKWFDINEKVSFDFGSLIRNRQTKDKIDNIANFANVLDRLIDKGVIDTSQYAKSIRSFAEKNVVDLSISDEDIEKLKDTFLEESEEYERQ